MMTLMRPSDDDDMRWSGWARFEDGLLGFMGIPFPVSQRRIVRLRSGRAWLILGISPRGHNRNLEIKLRRRFFSRQVLTRLKEKSIQDVLTGGFRGAGKSITGR